MNRWTTVALGLVVAGAAYCATRPGPAAGLVSGVQKGNGVPVFNPTHVTGADRGTTACPV